MFVILLWILSSAQAYGHEMTPTYPKLRPSYTDGLFVLNMKLFNRRDDVKYYEIQVFDKDWNPIPFATSEKLIKTEYLGKKDFELYIRERDSDKVEYVCTLSKLLKSDIESTGITSKICSKIKRE
jgi:hypothetical protein